MTYSIKTNAMVYIIMGVSASGKSTVGKKLAHRLELPFYDADDFHPQENIDKMKAGQPLTDADRRPWLQKLARTIPTWQNEGGAVLACSALKKTYRKTLQSNSKSVQFIYLKASRELIKTRMEDRDHFMPADLLDSQFSTLEEPDPNEAIVIDADLPPKKIIYQILHKLRGANHHN